jgi:hypothetical protein
MASLATLINDPEFDFKSNSLLSRQSVLGVRR